MSGFLKLCVEKLHLVVVKVIFAELSLVFCHHIDLMLGKMQVLIELSNFQLKEQCHKKYKPKLNTISQCHRLFPHMKFVLMSLLLFIEIKHILVQLVNELIGLVELMLVIQEVVGLRVVHDG